MKGLTFEQADSFVQDDFPEAKVLLVIDSYGNTVSLRDSAVDMTQNASMVGGVAKTNRMGIGSIALKQLEMELAVLVVNYNYANIGSVGFTNAGGKALDFHCMLTIQSSRKAWYEKTIKGQKVRAGADVLWRSYKNHYAKALKDSTGDPIYLPKEIILRISDAGLNLKDKSEGASEE